MQLDQLKRREFILLATMANSSLDVIRLRLVQIAGLYLRARERWRAYDVYLSAMLIFAASRLVVILGVDFGKLLVHPGLWDAGPAWYHRLLRWDSGWYEEIVSTGYRYSTSVKSPTVFYPLYPLVSYAVKSLFGINSFEALLLVANTASLVAVFLMTKFVRDELGDEIALLSLAFFVSSRHRCSCPLDMPSRYSWCSYCSASSFWPGKNMLSQRLWLGFRSARGRPAS
jgi:hypothetical protein